ncbi:hypothetical protein BDM02DRAFT_2978921 [Thelephora ganbajun]|uniref:Uncharacterized protein n=1 Tax=Thelephora ganbajun TaxID=370292 RepID=A0ACB6ZBF6_THEGA|nr:hypothetical protein BDM02DRAFT_2978921 [Thelephora ganbajun]
MEADTVIHREPRERAVVRRGMETREVHRDARAMGGYSISESVGEGADTSFDGALDIVGRHMRHMVHRTLLHMAHRGFLPLRSHARLFARMVAEYYYRAPSKRSMGLLTWFSAHHWLVVSVFQLRVAEQIKGDPAKWACASPGYHTMATASRSPSLRDLEVQLLQKIQENSTTFLDLVAFAIHRIVRDDVVIFSAPTAYFLVADPHFGLSLLVTLCLTELTNGIVKLYCIRPRPLWVSTKLQRKGSVWEKDSSFPSSHAQSVATLFSFLFLEGKEHLPGTVWLYASLVTGGLTLLTGFSRAYLAMHFASDVRYSPHFILSPLFGLPRSFTSNR